MEYLIQLVKPTSEEGVLNRPLHWIFTIISISDNQRLPCSKTHLILPHSRFQLLLIISDSSRGFQVDTSITQAGISTLCSMPNRAGAQIFQCNEVLRTINKNIIRHLLIFKLSIINYSRFLPSHCNSSHIKRHFKGVFQPHIKIAIGEMQTSNLVQECQ